MVLHLAHRLERMTEVHEHGSALICVVDEEEAEVLAAKATEIARANSKPLVVKLKPFHEIDGTRS